MVQKQPLGTATGIFVLRVFLNSVFFYALDFKWITFEDDLRWNGQPTFFRTFCCLTCPLLDSMAVGPRFWYLFWGELFWKIFLQMHCTVGYGVLTHTYIFCLRLPLADPPQRSISTFWSWWPRCPRRICGVLLRRCLWNGVQNLLQEKPAWGNFKS